MPDSFFFSFPCILLRKNPSPQKTFCPFPASWMADNISARSLLLFPCRIGFFGCRFEVFRNPRHPLPPPFSTKICFPPRKHPFFPPHTTYVRHPLLSTPSPTVPPRKPSPFSIFPPFFISHPFLLTFPPAQKKRSFPSASLPPPPSSIPLPIIRFPVRGGRGKSKEKNKPCSKTISGEGRKEKSAELTPFPILSMIVFIIAINRFPSFEFQVRRGARERAKTLPSPSDQR